jgi:eukaryotic-like serine/threonine-protein kinase
MVTLPLRIGPYQVLRKLGQGGMAQVLLALAVGASGFQKHVALKTLLPELVGDGELERLLIEEARLMAGLSHRGLVQVHDLGVDDGVYYVRLDWVDGVDLRALRPLPVELVLLIAEELAAVLAYVHAACDAQGRPLGLVHRDVSPSNVLVSRSGEVRLADFGLAKATRLRDVTRANQRKGTYAYMSPEQAAGEPLSAASDQFSLGATLYELATGRRPFEADTVHGTLDAIARSEPDLEALPPALRPLLGRCLGRAASSRYASMAELGHAIAAARLHVAPVGPLDLAARVAASAETKSG